MSVDAVAAWERGRLARLRAGGARTQGISGGRARLTRLRAGDARTQSISRERGRLARLRAGGARTQSIRTPNLPLLPVWVERGGIRRQIVNRFRSTERTGRSVGIMC